MKYSVILPCHNEAHILDDTLSGLVDAIAQRKDIEVIVVNNNSTDNSVEISKKYGCIVHNYTRKNISGTRNFGALKSNGMYLYFLDADILVPPTLFSALDNFIEDGKFDVLGFVDLAPQNSPWFARTWSLRSFARREKFMSVQWLPGRNILVSRKFFDIVNGFNELLVTSEDKDFVLRLGAAGARIASDPSLILTHLGFERTFTQWCRKEFWRQHNQLGLLNNQGVKLRLLRFPILALFHIFLLALLITFLIRGISPSPVLIIIWFIPSIALTLSFKISRQSGFRLPQFIFLYWVRFHIAAFAITSEFSQKLFRGSN